MFILIKNYHFFKIIFFSKYQKSCQLIKSNNNIATILFKLNSVLSTVYFLNIYYKEPNKVLLVL